LPVHSCHEYVNWLISLMFTSPTPGTRVYCLRKEEKPHEGHTASAAAASE